jgi:DNA (cytosine-5)-methyltransferase 1
VNKQGELNELALFAGAGGGILGGKLLGWRTVCAVEWEPYPASVLCARQNDGLLPSFPIWDDVQTFDGKPWRGIVDVVSGGFPCQDISAAGKGAGIDGERSGMWREMARIIHEIRPRYALVENSPMLTSRGLGTVLGDLAAMGFDARWGVLGAADVGAVHQRDRIWIVATNTRHSEQRQQESLVQQECSKSIGEEFGNLCKNIPNTTSKRLEGRENIRQSEIAWTRGSGASIGTSDFWAVEPNVGRVADGVAARVDRLKAIGNGQVPLCAATAWRLLNAA